MNSVHINEERVGHTAVSSTQASSVTLFIWQYWAKENYNLQLSRGWSIQEVVLSKVGQTLNVG